MTATSVHSTAAIHPSAQLGDGVDIGPYAVIGEDVVLGPRVRVGPHAVVEYAEVGEGCQIHAGAFVGTAPQDLKYRGERTRLVLGPGCTVREAVTLNRGTAATGLTKIGARCLFMAYSHVAHDCIIGSEVIVANSVAIAGHCEIGDWVVLGGMVGLHQFIRVGKLAMIGAGAMVPLDIPPFAMAQGDRAVLHGLNLVGLRRRGFSSDDITAVKQAYRALFFTSGSTLIELAQRLASEAATAPVRDMARFILESSRGVCRPAARKAQAEDQGF